MANRAQQRREARKSGGSDMTKFYWTLGLVAVIGVGAVGYQVASHKMGTAATAPVDLKGLEDPTALMKAAQAITKGDPNAPVTILEFGDYECPACGTFALTVQPQVEAKYVTPGKAKFVFYDFPLVSIHPTSFIAARAGRCAVDQDRFWQYHDELYRNQNSWVLQANPIKTFIGYAKDLGMDADAFGACLNSDKYADVVTANLRLAQQLGLNGTPTIMVGLEKGMPKRLGDDFSYKAIAALVDQVLAEAAAQDSAASGGS
ncbi:MAG: DsbA family protein [Gemmatimonadetes bacterium]|nr:DsbA family protein [Gemmatimonadota bacterium]